MLTTEELFSLCILELYSFNAKQKNGLAVVARGKTFQVGATYQPTG